jgi:hypothetical protein
MPALTAQRRRSEPRPPAAAEAGNRIPSRLWPPPAGAGPLAAVARRVRRLDVFQIQTSQWLHQLRPYNVSAKDLTCILSGTNFRCGELGILDVGICR